MAHGRIAENRADGTAWCGASVCRSRPASCRRRAHHAGGGCRPEGRAIRSQAGAAPTTTGPTSHDHAGGALRVAVAVGLMGSSSMRLTGGDEVALTWLYVLLDRVTRYTLSVSRFSESGGQMGVPGGRQYRSEIALLSPRNTQAMPRPTATVRSIVSKTVHLRATARPMARNGPPTWCQTPVLGASPVVTDGESHLDPAGSTRSAIRRHRTDSGAPSVVGGSGQGWRSHRGATP